MELSKFSKGNLLHPLVSLEWEEFRELPVKMYHAQAVYNNGRIYIGGGYTSLSSSDEAKIFIFSNLTYETVNTPVRLFALTVFNNQVTLIGGEEYPSETYTNKLYILDEYGRVTEDMPPMKTKRKSASAVSHGVYLIIAGGSNNGPLDIVEVYSDSSKQWSTAQPLPRECYKVKTVVHNGRWILSGGVYQNKQVWMCTLDELIQSSQQSDTPQPSVWSNLTDTPHEKSSVAVMNNNLLLIGGYSPLTRAIYCYQKKEWIHIGEMPTVLDRTCTIVLPTGELMVVGGMTETGSRSNRVFKGHVRVTQEQLTLYFVHPVPQMSQQYMRALFSVTYSQHTYEEFLLGEMKKIFEGVEFQVTTITVTLAKDSDGLELKIPQAVESQGYSLSVAKRLGCSLPPEDNATLKISGVYIKTTGLTPLDEWVYDVWNEKNPNPTPNFPPMLLLQVDPSDPYPTEDLDCKLEVQGAIENTSFDLKVQAPPTPLPPGQDLESVYPYLNEEFRKQTRVLEFTDREAQRKTSSHSERLTLKMGDSWRENTLEELEQFRIALSSEIDLSSRSLQTYRITMNDNGSLSVLFMVPKSQDIQVGHLRQFFFSQSVLKVMVDGRVCLDLEKYYVQLKELVFAAVLNEDTKLLRQVIKQLPEQGKPLLDFLPQGNTAVPPIYKTYSPLMVACERSSENLEMVELLLDEGASPTYGNKEGLNAVHIACLKGSVEVVKLHLNHMEPSTETLKNVVHYASAGKNVELMKWLLENVEAMNSPETLKQTMEDGKTSLHFAATADSPEITQLLIDKGCDPAVQDVEGNTALHLAYLMDSSSVKELLEGVDGGSLIETHYEQWIPSEIQQRGSEAVKLYKEALREGRQKIPRCNLLIFGEEGVGKTSMYRRLVNLPFQSEWILTRGIDNSSVETDIDIVGVKQCQNWMEKKEGSNEEANDKIMAQGVIGELCQYKRLSVEELSHQLNEITREIDAPPESSSLSVKPSTPVVESTQRVKQAKTDKTPLAKPTVDEQPFPSISTPVVNSATANKFSSTQVDSNMPPTSASPAGQKEEGSLQVPTVSDPTVDVNISHGFRHHIGKMLTSPDSKEEPTITLNVYDFAGQKHYYPMHQCFVVRRAADLVVFNLEDMEKLLNNKPISSNPLERVRYWLHAIHAHIHSPDDDKDLKRVILVGTHKGKFQDNFLFQVHKYLEDKLKLDKCADHIFYVGEKSNRRIFIAVENSSVNEEESGINELKAELQKLLCELPFLKEEYPISWLRFESSLAKLKKKKEVEDSSWIVQLDKVLPLALQEGINNPDKQDQMLCFFHDTGKIVCLKYLNSQQPQIENLVILDSQWLIGVMQELMEIKVSEIKEASLAIKMQKGVADEALLHECWSKYCPDEETFQQLCLILQCYYLIHPITPDCGESNESSSSPRPLQRSQYFLVPSMLPDMTDEDKKACDDDLLWLSFFFDFHKFLPDMIFHRLICLIIAAQNKIIPEQNKLQRNYLNKYFSTCCRFNDIQNIKWLVEFQRDNHRIKVSILLPSCDQTPPSQYILTIHQEYLMMICQDSGLKGIGYYGGPLLKCECGESKVAEFVQYPEISDDQLSSVRCSTCLRVYDVDQLLTLHEKTCKEEISDREKGFSRSGELHGVEVCGETTVVVTNSIQFFHWEGYGLKLHIPHHCLPADLKQCTIKIQASLAGQYQFPENCHLVSAVYWFRCEPSCKFTKLISVEMQHCAQLESVSKLNFVRSRCTQKQLPYMFKLIGPGSFSENSSCGVIQIDKFSGLGVTQHGPVERVYFGQMFYLDRGIVDCLLDIYFVITWKSNCHYTVTKNHYKRKGARDGPLSIVGFEDNHIKLDIPDTGITEENGWKITPQTAPHVVFKDMVDEFTHNQQIIPPCHIRASYKSGDGSRNVPELEHQVRLIGAKEYCRMFTISYHPQIEGVKSRTSTYQCWLQLVVLIVLCLMLGLVGWFFTMSGSGPAYAGTRSLQRLETLTVVQVFSKVGNWEKLCLNLSVNEATCNSIKFSHTENKLQLVVEAWLQQDLNANWGKVVKVLCSGFQLNNLAYEVAKKHNVKYGVVCRSSEL